MSFVYSPSGCTFWGKKPWSRKKKILWQLGTLVGAPVGIALVAGITVPAMIIGNQSIQHDKRLVVSLLKILGIPVWVGRKLYTRYKSANKHKRNAAIIGGVIASVSTLIKILCEVMFSEFSRFFALLVTCWDFNVAIKC